MAPSLPHDATLFTADVGRTPDYLASIDRPTLAIGGTKSPAMLQAAVRVVAEAVSGAESRLLPGQTHDVSTDVLAPVIRDFVAAARPHHGGAASR